MQHGSDLSIYARASPCVVESMKRPIGTCRFRRNAAYNCGQHSLVLAFDCTCRAACIKNLKHRLKMAGLISILPIACRRSNQIFGKTGGWIVGAGAGCGGLGCCARQAARALSESGDDTRQCRHRTSYGVDPVISRRGALPATDPSERSRETHRGHKASTETVIKPHQPPDSPVWPSGWPAIPRSSAVIARLADVSGDCQIRGIVPPPSSKGDSIALANSPEHRDRHWRAGLHNYPCCKAGPAPARGPTTRSADRHRCRAA